MDEIMSHHTTASVLEVAAGEDGEDVLAAAAGEGLVPANSAADNARYDELRGKRTELYKEAIPFIEKAFELKPDISTGKYLRDLYSAAFMTDKFNEMKQKIADMEAGN